MKTLNSVSDFAIIHYGWSEPIMNSGTVDVDPGLPGRLLKLGAHFVTFQRSKNIGGSAAIECFGVVENVEIGDWIVLKLSSNKQITKDNYAKTGIVKFIGQVASSSINHFADGDGNLRVTTQLVVREWSHALNMPVKYEQLSALINSKQFTQLNQLVSDSLKAQKPNSEDVSKIVEKYLSRKFNPFQATEIILSIVGAISTNTSFDKQVQRFESSNRLPAIPKTLLEENIVAFASNAQSINWISPWDTGAIAQIIGVQKTNKVTKLEEINRSLETYLSALDLEKNTRPGKSFERPALNSAFSVVDAIGKASGSNTLYEIYTDLVFTKNKDTSWSSTPCLVVRDKPISYKKIWKSVKGEDYAQKFEWTFIDFVPRVEVDSAAIISININQSISNAYNFLSFSLAPQSFKATVAASEAKANGVRANVPSQFRYGTQVFEEVVQDYIIAEKLQDIEFNEISGKWFKAISIKALNYFTHMMLFPTANLHIKDIEYPLSVGNMISIKLPTGMEIVGEVEKINSQIKVQGDGKHTNDTYIDVSKLSMVDSTDGLLMPIPPRVLKNLLKISPTEEDKKQILSIWKYRE